MEITGTVFKGGSAKLLARVVNDDRRPLQQAEVVSAKYSVYLLGRFYGETVVTGHDMVWLDVSLLVFDALQNDGDWNVDQAGYNFKHELDVSENAAFAKARRTYRVVFELTPTVGQVIMIRVRIWSA